MANFDTIKTAIDANINTNGKQEITGSKMNSILKQMVDATDTELTELESIAISHDIALHGVSYSESFKNIEGGKTYSCPVKIPKGHTILISFSASSAITCVMGVTFADGTHAQNLAVLYESGRVVSYTATKDVKQVNLYIVGSSVIEDFSIQAEVTGGVLEPIKEIIPNFNIAKATSVFYAVLEISFIAGVCSVKFTKTSPNTNNGYIYSDKGYIEMRNNIDKSMNYTTGVVVVYAHADDILLSQNYVDIPKDAIILEVFYSYEGNYTHAVWVSPFITRKDNLPNEYCSYANPRKIANMIESINGINIEVERIFERITNLESSGLMPKPKSVKIFQRVGCIGDSYTAGYISTSQGLLNSYPNNAWPHYMEGLTNNRYENWGVSGSTAKGWVLGAANLAKVKQDGNKCQAYMIGLMVNDRNNADWNSYYTPVGIKSDIGTDNDSYYAYYYKLVQEVVKVNPEAKIFCNTCPKWSENDSYNIAVKDIVAYCKAAGQNVYLLDLASSKYAELYQEETFEKDYINGHYTAIGYEYMAECYMQVISDVINENVAEFQNVAYIPFDEVVA